VQDHEHIEWRSIIRPFLKFHWGSSQFFPDLCHHLAIAIQLVCWCGVYWWRSAVAFPVTQPQISVRAKPLLSSSTMEKSRGGALATILKRDFEIRGVVCQEKGSGE
jgi:hypothetical protein